MSIAFIDLKAQQVRIRNKIETGLRIVLDHGAYIMGPEINALETRLRDWTGATHNITCSSGTDALLLTLMGLELKAGQGVIVPSFTFAASAEVMVAMSERALEAVRLAAAAEVTSRPPKRANSNCSLNSSSETAGRSFTSQRSSNTLNALLTKKYGINLVGRLGAAKRRNTTPNSLCT